MAKIRKIRKDKNKRRLLYRGRPVKKKRKFGDHFIPYKSKRQRGDPLKVFIWEKQPMTIDGYQNWNRKLRPYIRRITFKPRGVHLAEIEEISCKENIAEFVIKRMGHEGDFQLRLFGKRKNHWGVSPINKCNVRIIESESGFRALVFPCGIERYWFWRKQ